MPTSQLSHRRRPTYGPSSTTPNLALEKHGTRKPVFCLLLMLLLLHAREKPVLSWVSPERSQFRPTTRNSEVVPCSSSQAQQAPYRTHTISKLAVFLHVSLFNSQEGWVVRVAQVKTTSCQTPTVLHDPARSSWEVTSTSPLPVGTKYYAVQIPPHICLPYRFLYDDRQQ